MIGELLISDVLDASLTEPDFVLQDDWKDSEYLVEVIRNVALGGQEGNGAIVVEADFETQYRRANTDEERTQYRLQVPDENQDMKNEHADQRVHAGFMFTSGEEVQDAAGIVNTPRDPPG